MVVQIISSHTHAIFEVCAAVGSIFRQAEVRSFTHRECTEPAHNPYQVDYMVLVPNHYMILPLHRYYTWYHCASNAFSEMRF